MMMNDFFENKENLNELTDEQQEAVTGGTKRPLFNRDEGFPTIPVGIPHSISQKKPFPPTPDLTRLAQKRPIPLIGK